jgi:DNA mismatch repair protein MutL
MTDIIKILPDSVANQIAAGEVVQRPASAVKELLENAIDAGADDIQLIIKDAGKTLIQVVDNGQGMSETDARLCFERHATSKINDAHDLFTLVTFGFRGEALASIAAVSQLEMKTKRVSEDLGTLIVIEGSVVKEHTACSTATGTSISVKNLFFNVPARRNFLKSDATETTYIIEEFNRVALVYPHITFSFYNYNKLVTRLEKTTLRQRINQILGTNYGERLISVDEKTTVVNITGFIGKPEFARKTRGEQYFFVNNRYIRHPYLHHAVEKAFSELIPENSYASYFIYLTVDPNFIDVNIHPTKTEVKFQDEKTIYSILKAAIRKSFGAFNITPSLDFETERSLDFGDFHKDRQIVMPGIKVNTDYNPFVNSPADHSSSSYSRPADKNLKNWEALYNIGKDIPIETHREETSEKLFHSENIEPVAASFFMYGKNYIVTPVKSGLMIIDIANARERISYDKFSKYFESQKPQSQRLLFPQTLSLNPADTELLSEMLPGLRKMGFEVESFGQNTFVVNAMPLEAEKQDVKDLIEHLLEAYKKNMMDARMDKKDNLARSLARNLAIKGLRNLSNEEMQSMVGELFISQMPETSPSGKKIIFILPLEEIEKKFK